MLDLRGELWFVNCVTCEGALFLGDFRSLDSVTVDRGCEFFLGDFLNVFDGDLTNFFTPTGDFGLFSPFLGLLAILRFLPKLKNAAEQELLVSSLM